MCEANDFCDYHFHDVEKGKIVVTIEGKDIDEEMSKMKKIEQIPHVIYCQDMMMAYSEDELESARARTQEQADVVPSVLNDETIALKDIVYKGEFEEKNALRSKPCKRRISPLLKPWSPAMNSLFHVPNLNGKITYANETFAQISGYEIDELIGKPHNIVRHRYAAFRFKTLWETLQRGEMWKGYVKNLRKDGGYYWVYAEVSGVYKEGVLVEYKSLRAPMDEVSKIKMQREIDEKCATEENKTRVVVYLQNDIVHKVETLAREKACSGDMIMNDILSDALF